ncbi:MAG TPA: NAD-dependent epimerase/dehydratase family protein [Acidimicrobiales bacterium]|nr:NAD-dependent epimerase/dehydratase family protein [Acidimicrobiales bacterium]
MKIALTGANGFVGSHILAELQSRGHEVVACVRDNDEAGIAEGHGAISTIVDLYDSPALANLFGKADGAVHTASPGDETSPNLDSAVVDAAVDAYAGSGRPYAHIGGVWNFGSNTTISEETPFNPAGMVAWQPPVFERILGEAGMRGIVILSSVAYGDGGGGVPGVLLGSPRDADGNLVMVGTGQQHWSIVHVADLAEVFRRVLEDEGARGTYVVGNGQNPTVAELTEAAAAAVGAPGAVPGSEEEARGRLGDYFAEALLLDQATTAAKVRAVLGWVPTHPGLSEEFRTGSYRQ